MAIRLARALGLRGGESVAFVGAGGKTAAIFSLAGELNPPVVVATSTHLGAWQAKLAEDHHILSSPEEITKIDIGNRKAVLITGPLGKDERLNGFDLNALQLIHQYCQAHGYSLLIEANGARQRPLKAPADYEPLIPPWVDQVVVMAGLAVLGKPLGDQVVHRAEIFSQQTGCSKGEAIQVEDLVGLLGSDLGGLKSIPQSVERILFLNQAEGEIRMAQGARIARELGDVYKRVLVGSLQKPAPGGPVFSVHAPTAGIILAAGGSERLGQPKQLLEWRGKPFVFHVAQNAVTAGLQPIWVVTGADRTRVEDVLADLPVRCVYNPDWAGGQSTSMKTGLASLPSDCERAMFLLCDQPQISPLLIRQLIERHSANWSPIIMPLVQGNRGNPVLFGRETFESLMGIQGDQGGRAIFSQYPVDFMDWVDSRCLLDVDDEEDLSALKRAYFLED